MFFREYYLISTQWVGKDNSHVGVVWMNRAQNLTVYSSCYAPNWTCTEVCQCRFPGNSFYPIYLEQYIYVQFWIEISEPVELISGFIHNSKRT